MIFQLACSVSIAEVGFDYGFATQSQLTKYFSRFVGTTPKVYRDRA
ncbi:MAG: helix-turn-helix domain-containing protein [Lyngbya sp. HA4199-MV5]|nr:helix-turn-helix domain-containing protein [Lyngbya sp. HA4199-MV5]